MTALAIALAITVGGEVRRLLASAPSDLGHRLGLVGVGARAGGREEAFAGDLAPFGLDAAGLDDDDVDAERLDLQAQAVAEGLDGELGAVVPAAERRVDLAAHRADVHDGATALLAHVRQHELRQAHRAEHVDVELAARLVERHVLDGAVGAIAGVVDQDVDAAGLGDDLLDTGAHGVVVGDVHRQRPDAAARELLEALGAARGAVDGVAELVQLQGGDLADAGGGSGDEGGLGGHGVVLV